MALFKKTTEETKEKTVKTVVPKEKTVAVKESPLATQLLLRPRVTEKAYALNALNQFVFIVAKEATKKSIKRAVEEAYSVTVEQVNIVKLPAKTRVMGKNIGTKGAIKKAIISVKKGQTIELFKGGM
ncbi:MAG: 50S ribosomal protein L23 [Candidatus Moranbacteria bacterium]|nr:50S ribosomal protein L23 [Candidatus Moranbacteria bacterium]MDD3964458.1 50S ribosomal protein L23 [Candidatus Moranbacteria bacterium]